MSNEKDLLKSLLLKEELKLLEQLKEKLLSKKQFTEEVSKVLSGAIKRAQNKNPDFERALATPIQKGVTRAFTQNKQTIIDGLLPIMGQLIRKTVSNSIKQVVADINRILELGFSRKALKWRWQSFQTGESFAEIVFQKTIRYQVNEIFLINRDNGLLIEHVGIDDMLKDNNAISAMLSVIQEFVGDSLQSPDDNLQSAEIGDNLLFFSHGPKAFLAFVIKGLPTERFKSKSFELIENVHASFSEDMTNETTYRNNLELQDYLRTQLVTKNISDSKKETNWTPWIVVILSLLIAMVYWSYQRNTAFNKVVNTANAIEGLYLQSVSRKKGKFVIKGLADPLADIKNLIADNIKLEFKPFISLDHGIVKKRVFAILSNYEGCAAKIIKDTVILSGFTTQKNSLELVQQIKSVPGINYIENKMSVNDTELVIMDPNDALINNINNTQINIPLLEKEDSEQIQSKLSLIKSLHSLLEKKATIKASIIGESDCNGFLSNDYSENRAKKIMKTLIQSGIDKSILFTEIKACTTFDGFVDNSKLNVSFRITTQKGYAE